MTILRKLTSSGHLLGLAAGLFFLCGCSRQAEPVKASSVQQAAVQVPSNAGATAVFSLEPSDKTGALFDEYVRQLKAGDLIQASANLATLKGQLRGEDMSDPFWAEHLPAEHRVLLLIGALCTNCSDGSCPTCKGRLACQTCAGTGLCKACEGQGGDWIACVQCICKTCQGARFCMECKGHRFLLCPACNGTGNGREELKFEPCPSCGGRGYKDGLRGPNNTQSRVKCLRCNGAKGVYNTVRYPCASCDGSGRKNCGTCHGSGACPGCRGMGRTADCPTCHGQGRYLNPCPTCHGRKTCTECAGSKRCRACEGRGTCSECLGKNLVIRYRMPIDKRWLLFPDARAVRPYNDELIREPVTGSATSFSLEGKAVTAEVPAGALLWASASQDLRRLSGLFLQDE